MPPEFPVGAVDGDVDGPQAVRTGRPRTGALVGIAKVDDGANAVIVQRRPSGGGQSIRGVGANDRAAAGEPAVARGEPAEIPGVEAALEVQEPFIHSSSELTG